MLEIAGTPMPPGRHRYLARAATRVAVVCVLLTVASGCFRGGSEEEEVSARACGLIDRDVMSKVAGGRSWHDVGKLYHDGRFSDGCTVMVGHQQFVIVTLIEFSRSGTAAIARRNVLEERRALQRTCPQLVSPPVTQDSVTTACDSERGFHYTEWNPRRLIRLSLEHLPRLSLSTDDAKRLSQQINERSDEIEKQGMG